MASLVGILPDRIRYLTKINTVYIDDLVFRLHYRFTFVGLLVISIFLTCDQLFGQPIHCINGSGNDDDNALVPRKVVETFCWVEGTFTLPGNLDKEIGTHVAHPGISQYKGKEEVILHAYYQWVALVLFVQSMTFYVTHILWKRWENGRIQAMMNDLNKHILKQDEKDKQYDIITTYLLTHLGMHNTYALRYFFCEVFNLVIVILHMVIINWFLGGQFSRYGPNVIDYLDRDPMSTDDPMAKIFPKVTKCTFRHFGPSGDVQKFDNLCILPLNILNEKIYVILWFWLYILAILSGIVVVYHFILLVYPRGRNFLMHKFHQLVPAGYFETVMARCKFGDWFILYMLGKNLDTMHYRDVILQLANKLDDSGLINGKA